MLANRLQTGSIDGIGQGLTVDDTSSVPFSRRYFLGGSTSLRGWGRLEVSPLSGGLPIGGLTMLEVNSELRLAISRNISVVAFIDAGNAWESPWQFELDDLRAAVGPGVRYRTPIGPVRADVGYQLTPIEGLVVNGEPEKRHWRVHFSIGQAF